MADLAHVLRQLPRLPHPDLLEGSNPADDAAIFRLRDDLALVQTLDFLTPIVDDPYTFGLIAAANSLSDVYAVGGEPITALNVVAFPIKDLPAEVLGEILRGGAEKAAEAGVPIVGGHTVEDAEPKYGLSVTGTVHPDRYVPAHGAQPGDLLVLTKPIGTGVIATALKAGEAASHHVDEAVRWMATLNRGAARAMLVAGARAATDVTGYGLLGHLSAMCAASGVAAELEFRHIPLLPGAAAYSRDGHSPGGAATNLDYLRSYVNLAPGLQPWQVSLLVDPQTSGGLLVCVPEEAVPAFVESADSTMESAVIGRIVDGPPGRVTVAR